MPVEAKIAASTAGINAAPVQTIGGPIAVAPGGSVALNVAPEAVAGYAREGTDLLVHLRSGEVVRLANFYVDPSKVSHLFLVSEDQLVAAEVGNVGAGAMSSATYVPIDATAGFAAPGATAAAAGGADAAAGAAAGAGAGGFGAGTLIPLAALAAGGLAVAATSSGGDDDEPSTPAPTPPDTTAPGAATNLAIAAAGDRLTGSAEAGATVRVDVDGNGSSDYTATVGANGTFAIALSPPLVNGQVVRVTVADAAGNVGAAATVAAPDTTMPAPAASVAIAANGTGLTGIGEAGSTVTVDVDRDGDVDYTAAIGANGTFSISFATPIDNGQEIDVTITDPAGNDSTPVTITAPDLSPAPATAPILDPTNGTVFSGTAQSGVAVVLSDATGNTIGQATIDAGGAWSFTPTTPLPDGTVVEAVAVNALGEAGPATTVTVDAVPPATPEIDPSNGSLVTGTAEAGATVVLVASSGDVLGQVTAGADGTWSFAPDATLGDGAVVNALARDAAGNDSAQASVTIDAVAPFVPTINPPSGAAISGTAEPGSTVVLTNADGAVLAEVTAGGTGVWAFAPATPFADGTVINAFVRDAAGNTSPPATATVDASSPATPTVAASDGEVLSGTAEVGSTVILTDGGGNPIAQVVADGDGEWTFTPTLPLPEGTIVLVTARDAVGNTSAVATTTIDRTPPAAPEITPSNGVVVSGTAEAGAIVTVTDGNSTQLGQTIADGDGNWSILPASPLPDGTVVTAVAADPAGNMSLQSSITVDAIAPLLPTIDPTDGTEITGIAEAGTRVVVTDSAGKFIGEVTADGSGSWSVVPAGPLPDGTALIVTAVDPSGNTSPNATATVDAVPPVQPTIESTNGSVIIGTAEPNSTVILLDGTGGPQQPGVQIGELTADGDGNWSFDPLLPLPEGTVVIAVSVDAAGNASPPVNTTVDGTPPPIPTVEPTNGVVLTGTAEANATILLTDLLGDPIGETVANGEGEWTFEPLVPLLDGQLVNVTAVDAAGNPSLAITTVVDAVIPLPPVIAPSNGNGLTGTAEPNSTVILSTTAAGILAEVTVDSNGDWSFNPAEPLLNGTVVFAVAEDAAGNASPPAFTAIDAISPSLLSAQLSPDGAVLSGFAEPNSELSVVINGDTTNAIPVTVSNLSMYTLPFSPPLVANEVISVTAVDQAGNESVPINLIAPDIAPPTVVVFEAADGSINAVEAADGIEVEVFLRPTMQVGQVITVRFEGANGYEAVASHVLDATDLQVGSTTVAIEAVNGQGPLPDGLASITASVGAGGPSTPTVFTVDTTPPATPVLSLASSLLSISGADPGSELTVNVDLGGVSAGAVVTADGGGLASLNLLTDLDIDLGWDQLLTAQVSVVGEDAAGNAGNVATLSILPALEQPLTIGNFAVAANLNPLNPLLGVTGTTEPNATVAIQVLTPLLDATVAPIVADGAGNFALHLLSPDLLSQLGLDITDILGLGAQLSLQLVATDGQDRVSATYGVDLAPDGLLSLNIGQIDVNGTTADDILSGLVGSAERINSGSGNDLILDVATGDRVFASDANDTIEIEAGDFVSIDGGLGFDTLLLSSGIDLDYVGTLTNIERIDLGVGDGGSTLILTASEVDAITDNGATLQITGESNDLLSIAGGVDSGTTELHDGIVFNVYTFGVTNVLVEENTVQVAV